ncbi:23S rRNA (uracil(1939)-C(5))-methyltransferase RlmD [Paenibacillus protaetiae]|uniref:23S rRNA (Uracil(1939)-C(5))-methyltransferase RlmD n=1 Tax=Paenibacillus protaetiae TaxID=2509456 RepID=A0A4P6EUQ4_9BACL|nr:23S rRNA (uracil(1939)-C(5))-methyltransferase RlmD [Paenibacillus protaetiae]QAY66990.1 23S rRNA (uracil(1939)-C(5))-methyltransferase RlmD [Paenibacillus protaetiae]
MKEHNRSSKGTDIQSKQAGDSRERAPRASKAQEPSRTNAPQAFRTQEGFKSANGKKPYGRETAGTPASGSKKRFDRETVHDAPSGGKKPYARETASGEPSGKHSGSAGSARSSGTQPPRSSIEQRPSGKQGQRSSADRRPSGRISGAQPPQHLSAAAAERGSSSSSSRRPSSAAAAGSAEELHIGDRIVVTVKRIGINGEGVGYYKRKAVFIKGALPDEVVKAAVTKVNPGFLEADIVELEKKSPDRRKPPCDVYDVCGGCQLQHMSYEAQLRAKEEIVRESFQRYAGMQQLPMRPIIGMDDPWSYRNKAQLQAGKEGQKIITGLYAADSHRLIDISGCLVQDPVINKVMDEVKAVLADMQIPIYNEKTGEGTVRTIVARVAQTTGRVQLTFVTAADRLPDARLLVKRVRERLPMVVTVAQNIHKGKSSVIFGDKTVLLWGKERLDEQMGNVKFALSPRAFFQLNPEQTVKLYNVVQEAASLKGNELVVDAYCGTGTIGLWLAPHAGEVRGIELIPEAVHDARDNARTSGVDNARFYEGRAEQVLPEWVQTGVRPDVVVVDPPRTGCELPLLQAIVKAQPSKLVYVSCNPSTLAKDVKVLTEGGYRLEWVQPVDMFPQTSHVESVILMIRK